jgi:hypothetical protein
LGKALRAKTLKGKVNYTIDALEPLHGSPIIDELLHGLVEVGLARSPRDGAITWAKKLLRYRVLR